MFERSTPGRPNCNASAQSGRPEQEASGGRRRRTLQLGTRRRYGNAQDSQRVCSRDGTAASRIAYVNLALDRRIDGSLEHVQGVGRLRQCAGRGRRLAARNQHARDSAVFAGEELGVAVIALLVARLDAVAAYGAAFDRRARADLVRTDVVLGTRVV